MFINEVKRSSRIVIVLFLFLITIHSAMAACNETKTYSYFNFTEGSLIQNKTSIANITATQICTAETDSFLPIVMVVMVFIALFLFLAWMVEFYYARMIFVIITLGLGILLYALGMEIASNLGITAISNLMVSGYKIIIYSTVVIIGMMMLLMLYNLFMELANWNRGRKDAKR